MKIPRPLPLKTSEVVMMIDGIHICIHGYYMVISGNITVIYQGYIYIHGYYDSSSSSNLHDTTEFSRGSGVHRRSLCVCFAHHQRIVFFLMGGNGMDCLDFNENYG